MTRSGPWAALTTALYWIAKVVASMLIVGHVGTPDGRDGCPLLLCAIRAAFTIGGQTVILGGSGSGMESRNKFTSKVR